MEKETKNIKIVIDPKGPYAIFGNTPIYEYFIINGADGKALKYQKGDKNYAKEPVTYLCRCGMSEKKPYCDGSHLKNKWDSELTATESKFMDNVKVYEGKRYTLWDKENLCAIARFCDAGRGAWRMVMNPQSENEVELSLKAAQMCPAGRLVVQDNIRGKMLEPELPQAIGLIEDTPMGISGPIWVMGGIPAVTKDGTELERRNRVTLCRCGASNNKPYCDGAHLRVNFKDDNF